MMSNKALLVLVCGVVTSSVLGLAWEECNNTVSPSYYIAFPSLYSNTLVLRPDTVNCNLFQNSLFRCVYTKVLGDGVIPSATPNLEDSMYLKNFLAWQRESEFSYLDFDFTGSTVPLTAIRITILNNPANSISVPDVELYSVVYGSTNSLTPIASRLLDNQDLTLTDNRIRAITIAPLQLDVSSLHLRLSFTFTDLYSFDWLLLSEVTFCTSPLPLSEPSVAFIPPLSLTVQPGATELMNRMVQLVCSLSSQGAYRWEWRRDNSTLNIEHSVSVGDGSRTTILTLMDLTFASAGDYSCIATATDVGNGGVVGELTQTITFPENVVSDTEVSGMDEVVLVCEVHGYLALPSPPLWVDPRGKPLTESRRVNISISEGSNIIILENGTTVPSIVVTLLLGNLSSADEGNYTCKGDGGESVTFVRVVIPPPPTTCPPTTRPPTTHPPTTQPTTQPTTTNVSVFNYTTPTIPEPTTPNTANTSQPSLPLPVKVVISLIGGLTLLCLLMIIPPLILFAVQKLKYRLEERELESTTQDTELESIPETEAGSCDPIIDKFPPFKVGPPRSIPPRPNRGQFEQSEIFSYIKDL